MRKLRQINDALPGLTGGFFIRSAASRLSLPLWGAAGSDAVGLWAGIGCAVYWEFTWRLHCGVFWEKTAGRAGGGADSRRGGLRYAVVLGVFALLLVFRLGNPVLAFFGVMGLKVSAYLQPF